MRAALSSTLSVLLSLFVVSSAPAAPTIGHVKLDGLRGAAGAPTTLDVPIITYSFEIKSPTDVATGQATGRRVVGPLIFTKSIDGSSPQLLSACASNMVIGTATLSLMGAGANGQEREVFRLTLSDVTVVDIKHVPPTVSAGSGGVPVEEVTLVARQVTWSSGGAATSGSTTLPGTTTLPNIGTTRDRTGGGG